MSTNRYAHFGTWAGAFLVSLLFLLPVAWMLVTSLKPNSEIFTLPPTLFPKHLRWSNYPEAVTSAPFGRYFLNSVIVSSCAVVISVFVSSLAGAAAGLVNARSGEDLAQTPQVDEAISCIAGLEESYPTEWHAGRALARATAVAQTHSLIESWAPDRADLEWSPVWPAGR